MIGAKAQPTQHADAGARKRKNFQLRTGSWVRRIVHKDGRATGVQFTDANGEEFFQPAATVILASFTLNNTRLLYLSKIGTPYDPVTAQRNAGPQSHASGGRRDSRSFSTSRSTRSWARERCGTRISDFDGDIGLTGSKMACCAMEC